MSGFRKFRTSLHRRRRWTEAAELGFFMTDNPPEPQAGAERSTHPPGEPRPADPEASPLEFSPSLEAREIGPNPIAWMKPKRPGAYS